MMILFLLFVAIPILEIALFIQIGGVIGLGPTLLVIVATALLGTLLVRTQGLSVLSRVQTDLEGGRNPSQALADGAAILVAGILLLTPGFFTDAIGFALLTPPVRRWALAKLADRLMARAMPPGGPTARPRPETIDGDYTDLGASTPNPDPQTGPSGWVRHDP